MTYHPPVKDRTLRDILVRARHDGGSGLVGKAELAHRPVRRIVLMG